MSQGFIPPHGGYRKLRSYQKSLIVYEATICFCKRFYSQNRRQTDQMEQAARSGKQNIVEGSLASATSKQMEIHLTNVARASLGELQEDYEDFLRRHRLSLWEPGHQELVRLKTEAQNASEETYDLYQPGVEHGSPEVAANTVRHLILQTMFLLNRQLQRQERDLLQQGGLRKRMTDSMLDPVKDLPIPPTCPLCNAVMILRTARSGPEAGKPFWGCSSYPECQAIRTTSIDD